jgi:hypothetical protein
MCASPEPYAQTREYRHFFKEWKEVMGVGQHQVTKDAARVKRSVAVSLMAYLVLLRVRAKGIRPNQPWSAFAQTSLCLGGEPSTLQVGRSTPVPHRDENAVGRINTYVSQ